MIINEEKALEMVMGDRELFEELLRLTSDQLKAALPKLIKQSEESKWKDQSFTNRIHALKGAAGGCGAENLYQTAANLELELKNVNFEGAKRLFSDFISDSEQFIAAVEESLSLND